MKTKHTTTRRPTRKNKRIMSGGGKISKVTRRFKDHFKRFFKINENDKIKKCEAWGSLNGIFKFVEAQNEKYTGEDGTELSGLDKMIGNINKTPNSSNKDRYIKAIDCFKQGCDTILSGDKCVSYSDFVNGGGAPAGVEAPAAVAAVAPAVEAPVETPAAVAAVAPAVEAPVVSPAEEETSDSPAAQVDADKSNNAGQGEAVVPAAEAAAEDDATEATVAAEAPAADEDTSGDAEGAAATEGPGEEEKDAPKSQPPAASSGGQDGGRSRRRARHSQRIKSRKSKKGRMTRRKHRAVRR